MTAGVGHIRTVRRSNLNVAHADSSRMSRSKDFTVRCLPGDIDVLTEAGWRRGTDLRDGEQVATWHPDTSDVTLSPAQHVSHGRYTGPVISLVGGVACTTGNPERGVWARTRVRHDADTWTQWHLRPLADLRDLPAARIPVAGHRSGPGLRNDYGDYAAVLGWISLEEGYHGTSIHVRHSEANRHRSVATATRLAELGARVKRIPGRGAAMVDAWFLPGSLAATIRRDLIGGLIRWPAVWKLNSVELHAFVDGAVGGGRRTLHRLDRETVDLIQAIGALTGHRTTAYDLGRRTGATIDLGIGLDAPMSHDAIKRRVDSWDGPAFALSTTTGAVVARRNGRVFIAAA